MVDIIAFSIGILIGVLLIKYRYEFARHAYKNRIDFFSKKKILSAKELFYATLFIIFLGIGFIWMGSMGLYRTIEKQNSLRILTKDNAKDTSKTVMKDRKISKVNLAQMDVKEGYFENIKIINSNMKSINWGGSHFVNVEFINSELNFAQFTKIKCSNCKFINVTMHHANFSHSNLSDVTFINSDISGTSFAYLEKADRVGFTNTICKNLTLRHTVEQKGILCTGLYPVFWVLE